MKLFDRLFKSSEALLEIGNQHLFGLGGKDVDIPLAHRYFLLAAKKGNRNAANALELMFVPGTDQLRDEMKPQYDALRGIRLGVEAGDPEACFLYGAVRLNDEADDYMYRKGLEWVKFSAEAGHVQAMHHYGYELLYGRQSKRFPADKERGIAFVRRAAEQGCGKSIILLHSLGEKEEALRYAEQFASKENPEAISILAQLKLLEGNEEEALSLFERAASSGDKKAMLNLAIIYDTGEIGEIEPDKAIMWYRRAAESGDDDSCWILGSHYKMGFNASQDFDQAYHWFKTAADNGHLKSIFEIGLMHQQGVVVKQDERKAFETFEEISDVLPMAMRELGRCYSNGKGCERNLTKALACYESAASAGDAEAQFDLGLCYRLGECTPVDIPRAIEWYEKAIAQGHAKAMANCAILYDNGIGVEPDHEKAYRLYRSSAEAGYSQAQFCLGDMYFQGRHVERNYLEAVKWFELAARQGEPDSVFHLAICYSEGLGVWKDYRKATELLFVAADMGWQPAIDTIRRNNISRP